MKPYVKPELYYENFELAQHIAGCNISMTNTVEGNCTGNGTIGPWKQDAWFLDANDACAAKTEKYCYTNGAGTTVTVNS